MSKIRRLIVGVTTLVAIGAAASAAQARPLPIPETLSLHSHAQNVTGYTGPAKSHGRLPVSALYVATVSGSLSYWERSQWKHPHGPFNTVCGEPFFSSRNGGDVGIDAEFVYGRPSTKPCPTKPFHWANFEISTDGGLSYSHRSPLGGPFTAPTKTHTYSYPLVGSGQHAFFRLKDMPHGVPETADNYGTLTITLRGAVPSDCAAGGYLLFGEPTEAACITAT